MNIASITLTFEGKLLSTGTIYEYNNRYFISLFDFVSQIGGTFNENNNKVYIYFKGNFCIYFDTNNIKYKFVILDNKLHISLSDICRILNLKSRWNYDTKQILLYWNRDTFQFPKISSNGRPAFIRMEDVTAGNEYVESKHLEKVRVTADYMYYSGATFHIAWIPRFIDPPNKIDNDISRDFSMSNAHFLFTIDYLLYRNGTIGLHGYTHQYSDEVSAYGTEFNETRNTDETDIRKRIESAIYIANRLNLPYKFFETPHNAATAFQQTIFESYVDIIYEGYVGHWVDYIIKSPRNNRTLYIPTPLGYIEGENGLQKMIDIINILDEKTLASLFFHPYIEFDYITLGNDRDGYPVSTYAENSPLHLMINALYNKGCTFYKVTDMLKLSSTFNTN